MKIEIISCLSDNYSYLIHDEESNTVAIIDPSEFKPCDKIIKKYKQMCFWHRIQPPAMKNRTKYKKTKKCSKLTKHIA